MGILIACMASRGDRLQEIFEHEREALGVPGTQETDGWGLGFYQTGEILHKKHPQRLTEPMEWAEAVAGIRSHCVIAHARHATSGTNGADNTHPFRMRQWLFAHHGSIGRFDAIRGHLYESMPDFIRRNIRGDTDSECFFHTVLAFIHDAGQLENPEIQDQTVVTAVRSATRLVDRLAAEVGAEPPVLNVALTNGRQMYAVRRGAPMWLIERDSKGFPSPEDVSGDAHANKSVTRYVLLVSSPSEARPTGYREMENGSVAAVDRDLHVSTYTL